MIRPSLRGQRARSRSARLASVDADARPRDRHRPWPAGARQCHHGRRRRARRPRDDRRGRRAARRRARAGPDRRDRGRAARAGRLERAGLRGLPSAQRQRRDDRSRMGPRIGHADDPVAITNTHSVGVVRDALVAASVEGSDARTTPLVAAGRRRDLRRPAQRHQWLPRPGRAPAGGAGRRGRRAGRRGQRRRRHGDGLPRVQGRDRDGVAGHPGRSRRIHGRRRSSRPTTASAAWLRVDGVPVGEEIGVDALPSPYDAASLADARDAHRAGSGSIIVVIADRRPAPAPPVRARSPSGPASGSPGRAAPAVIPAATCSSPSRPGNRLPTPTTRSARPRRVLDVRSGRRRHHRRRCSTASSRRPRRRSSTPWSPPTTMAGRDGITAHALPHDRLLEVMARYGRAAAASS